MSKNKFGLAVGSLFALLHALWSLTVAIMPETLQSFLDWVMKLHHIGIPFTITTFHLMNALLLVILTFVVGYLLGWVIAFLLGAFKIVKLKK